MMPAAVHAEIVAAVDQAGHPVHDDPVARRRRDIEDDVPALARRIAGPVVVADHDAAVLGVAAGGDERAAMVGHARVARRRAFALVVATCRNTATPARRSAPPRPRCPACTPLRAAGRRRCRSARRDTPAPSCGQNMSLRGLAEELPVLLLVVRHLGGDVFEAVLDLGRQQVSVLKSDLGRACPPGGPGSSRCAPCERVAFFRRGSVLRVSRDQRKRQPEQQDAEKTAVRRIAAIIDGRADRRFCDRPNRP